MPSPLATVPALMTRLGVATLSDEDTRRAEAALVDASALVRDEAGGDTVWADPGTCPAAVVTVVLQVARRVFANPDGYSSESDGDYTYRRDADSSTLYLTDKEAEIVRRYRPNPGGAVRGLWTLPTTRGECGGSGFVYTNDSLDPVPWYPEEWL